MDPLDNLREAMLRVAASLRRGGRRPKKQKKVKAAGARPVGPGANVACGTGKGGFGIGNQCAKEDGIPQRPLSHGGAMKKVNAAEALARAKAMRERATAKKAAKEVADKKKSIETKPQRDKQKQINKLRTEAARRKAEKGERDAAEKQAAQEAADKRRAEMLQKIRIKKANEKLNVVEAPPAKFSGQIDTTIKKLEGETQFDFAKRRIDADLKKFHSEMDALEKRFVAEQKAIKQKITDLDEAAANALRQKQAYAQKVIGTDANPRNPTKSEVAEFDRLRAEHSKLVKEREEAYKRQDTLEKKYNDESHDLISEFVKTHNGGLAKFDADSQFDNLDQINRSTSKFAAQFKKNAKDAWAFLSKVSAPLHQQKGSTIKVQLDTSRGSADYDNDLQMARHGTLGDHGDYHTSTPVIVHEVAHGLHYGPNPPHLVGPDGKPIPGAIDKGVEWINAPGYKARAAIKEDYEARISRLRSDYNGEIEQVVFHEKRRNYKLWVPKGKPRQSESYLGYASQYSDAENGNATGATEVISVGVEQMFRSTPKFRSQFRSHFDLTLLFLTGRLH